MKTGPGSYGSCVYLFLVSAGADVGGQCNSGSEATGVAAQGGRPTSQRDGRVAEHAQLDLQTPPPVLPPPSVLQEEST